MVVPIRVPVPPATSPVYAVATPLVNRAAEAPADYDVASAPPA